MELLSNSRQSGTVAPIRPQPKALQSTTLATTSTESAPPADSGSSRGDQTSGSFILLPPPPPPGARLPDAQIRLDLPPLELMNPPPQRRLSRPINHKPLPPLPRTSERTNGQKERQAPPSSWAVPFRGWVKAVRWSRSDPQLNKRIEDPEKTKKKGQSTRKAQKAPETPGEDTTVPKPPSRNRLSSISLRKRTKSGLGASNINAGGLFLVPHVPNQPLRPPAPGWMHPVPVNPLEFASARTVIGHSDTHSRGSLDAILSTRPSPPLADLPVRKSVSEIGHGSITYAPMSPEASYSTIGDFPHFPASDSPERSQDAFPRSNIEFVNDPRKEEEDGRQPSSPAPIRSRFEGLKRALSFKRPIERKSASDIPSMSMSTSGLDEHAHAPPNGMTSRHRASKSVEIERPGHGVEMAALDKEKRVPNRLRRQSTLLKQQRDESPSSFRLKSPAKFMLSPDASESSILSTNLPSGNNLSNNYPYDTTSPPITPQRSTSGRRLVKRKPSENKKSSLPATLEVETPKSGDIPNPMESLVIPPPIPPPKPVAPADQPTQVPILPTPDTLGLPLSAPVLHPLTVKPPRSSSIPEQLRHPPPALIALPAPTESWVPTQPQRTTPRHEHTASFPPSNFHSPTLNTALAMNMNMGSPHSKPPPSAMWDLRPTMPHRPSLERRASRRRWTLNIAAEDAEDNVLKNELERLRKLGGEPSENLPDASWTLARKALLSSREVILTEQSYLTQLTRFLEDVTPDNDTPPHLIKHIPILVSASQAFCNRMQEDPSAWGVSAAFVTVEAVLEQVFVDYCQVVGQIMLALQASSNSSTPKSASNSHSQSGFLKQASLSKSKSIINGAAGVAGEFGRRLASKSSEKIGEDSADKGQGSAHGHSVAVSAWHGEPGSKSKVPRSRSMPGKDRRKSLQHLTVNDKSSTSLASPNDGLPSTTSAPASATTTPGTTPGPSPTHRRGGSLASGKARAITAADVAIAPPQRVTRYVMLFKDLLNATPLTAPSRPLVQRALDGALRIAENCDKAQGDLSLIMKRKP